MFQMRGAGGKITGLVGLKNHIMDKFEWISDSRAQLGEGPVWDARAQSLHWVDIVGGVWWQCLYAQSSERMTRYDDTLGFIVPTQQEGWLLGLAQGLSLLNREQVLIAQLPHPPEFEASLRYNDAKADPLGGLWVGVMDRACASGKGWLAYQRDGRSSWACQRASLSVPNGMAWSLDHQTLYFIDSPTQAVLAFSVDVATATITGCREVISTQRLRGYPDGMTIDNEGMLWIAHWGGACVSRWNPQTGANIGRVELPVQNVTSCTFGGTDYRTLFITTAFEGLSPQQRREQPLAGAVFALSVEAQGLPPHRLNYPWTNA
jgi:sugar lactone lactonase YvrE